MGSLPYYDVRLSCGHCRHENHIVTDEHRDLEHVLCSNCRADLGQWKDLRTLTHRDEGAWRFFAASRTRPAA